jgi:undecaprenyl pyrophosphate phosphatase UppP
LDAAALTAIKIPSAEYSSMPLGAYGLGFLTSFLFGLLSIWFLMKFLRKHSLLVFALYMLIVGLSVSLAG